MANAAVIGEPGTGKTTSLLSLVNSLEKNKLKMGVIDVDNKLNKTPTFQDAISRGVIDVFTVKGTFESGTLREVAKNWKSPPKKDPAGFLQICDAVDQLDAKAGEYFVRVLDTLTIAQEHLRYFLRYEATKVAFEYTEWLAFKNMMANMFTGFFDIGGGQPCLNIINIHQKNDREEATGRLKFLPQIDGGFRDEAASYVGELYQAYVEDKGKNVAPKYMWRVRPSKNIVCRTNIFEKDVTDVEQDWEPVFKRLLR